MANRRGNPAWGSSKFIKPRPPLASEFEIQLKELGLTKETCVNSIQLRRWCQLNRNRCYIPEWLLAKWDIPVDAVLVPKRMTRNLLEPRKAQLGRNWDKVSPR